MKNIRRAFIANILLFILELFAIAWMMSGINNGPFSAPWLEMLRYFTVDSNILMGIFALIAAIDEYKVLTKKKKEVSNITYILKLTGTVGVTLTMLVTIFFLAPTAPYNPLMLFFYSNFFLHLLNPIISIISLICFEKNDKITFKQSFIGIIPMLLYSVYYVLEVVTHTNNGIIEKGYDWYGFFMLGLKSAFFVLPLVIGVTYLISFVLWKLNRKMNKNEK